MTGDTLFGFPVVECEFETPKIVVGTYLSGEAVVDLMRRAQDAYVDTSVWVMHPAVAAKVRQAIRQRFLMLHHGRSPKARRTRRGGKRLL